MNPALDEYLVSNDSAKDEGLNTDGVKAVHDEGKMNARKTKPAAALGTATVRLNDSGICMRSVFSASVNCAARSESLRRLPRLGGFNKSLWKQDSDLRIPDPG
jgi:hypothetical protein